MINNYLKSITEMSESYIKQMINSEQGPVRDALRKALDTDGKESKYGRMSAGLFTFTLASLQKKIDDTVMGNITITYPQKAADLTRNANTSWMDILTARFWSGTESMTDSWNGTSRKVLVNTPNFISNYLLGSGSYVAQSGTIEDESKLTQLGSKIHASFLADSQGMGATKRGGMLNTTLAMFSTYDPIVVMQSIGNRFLDIVPGVFIAGTLATFVSGNFIGAGIAATITLAGLIFAYVVPITPVIFWLKALLLWLFMVIEAMVAAPFWGCAHAQPEGAGFAGQHARRGYLMLLDIVIRPRLLVIGAVLAIAMIQASGWMFNMLFNLWFANVTGTFVHIGMMADITFSIMVISTMYYNIITIFTKGVNYLPERVLSWCGGGSGSGLRDEKGGTAKIVAAGAVLSKSQSIVPGGANAITAGVKYGKSKFKGASEEAAGRRGAREQVVEKGRAIA